MMIIGGKKKRISISLWHWMFLVNARNCNSVQWQTQFILHRSLSHNLNFLPLQPLQNFCLGLHWPSAIWKLFRWSQCSRTLTLRPGKGPRSVKTCCFREPSKAPPWQGCRTWLVQEQAPSPRNRQRVRDPFGKNTPVEGNGKFICVHSQWGAVQPLLLLCITHPGSDHRQGTNWIVKSQKLSQPVRFWVSGEHSVQRVSSAPLKLCWWLINLDIQQW